MGIFSTVKTHALKGCSLHCYLFILENGEQPAHVVTRETGYSRRMVDTALAKLRRLGLLKKREVHDHDHVNHVINEPLKKSEAAAPRKTEDPLLDEMVELGMWEGAARAVLQERPDRERLQDQLAWHRHRLQTGYAFKGHPAALLTFLLRNPDRDGCPAGYYEARQRPEVSTATCEPSPRTAAPPARASERQAVSVTVAEQAPAEMTREGAMVVVRIGINSKLPFMRAEALRLAALFNIDTTRLGDACHGATG